MTKLSEDEVKTLRKIRSVLSDPQKWTKRAFARLPTGDPTSWDNNNACCWCLEGAILRSCRSGGINPIPVYEELHSFLPFRAIANFNDDDSTTHADVLNLLDRTIEKHAPAKTRISLTLSEKSKEKLDELSAARGLTRSQYLDSILKLITRASDGN